MPAISVENLTKTFVVKEKAAGLKGSLRSLWRPKTNEVHAVREIGFAVEAGERVAFIGPNGAGKSTTIKMLVGILYPTSGQATVLGHVPWKEREKLAREIKILESYLKANPNDQNMAIRLAEVYTWTGQCEDAIRVCCHAQPLHPRPRREGV